VGNSHDFIIDLVIKGILWEIRLITNIEVIYLEQNASLLLKWERRGWKEKRKKQTEYFNKIKKEV